MSATRRTALKAAVMYARHKPLVLDDLELIEPGPNEVEVELVASGVCHSDLHHMQQETWLSPPAVPGTREPASSRASAPTSRGSSLGTM